MWLAFPCCFECHRSLAVLKLHRVDSLFKISETINFTISICELDRLEANQSCHPLVIDSSTSRASALAVRCCTMAYSFRTEALLVGYLSQLLSQYCFWGQNEYAAVAWHDCFNGLSDRTDRTGLLPFALSSQGTLHRVKCLGRVAVSRPLHSCCLLLPCCFSAFPSGQVPSCLRSFGWQMLTVSRGKEVQNIKQLVVQQNKQFDDALAKCVASKQLEAVYGNRLTDWGDYCTEIFLPNIFFLRGISKRVYRHLVSKLYEKT